MTPPLKQITTTLREPDCLGQDANEKFDKPLFELASNPEAQVEPMPAQE